MRYEQHAKLSATPWPETAAAYRITLDGGGLEFSMLEYAARAEIITLTFRSVHAHRYVVGYDLEPLCNLAWFRVVVDTGSEWKESLAHAAGARGRELDDHKHFLVVCHIGLLEVLAADCVLEQGEIDFNASPENNEENA